MTQTAPTPSPVETITFQEFATPSLASGRYSVSVEQTVSAAAGQPPLGDPFSASLTFIVTGRRFALAPGGLTAQFPPAGARGNFSGALAHVLLADPTLPWRGSVDHAGSAAPGSGGDSGGGGGSAGVRPWLALLTFDAADGVPAIVPGSLADLLADRLPAGTASYPGLTVGPGEASTDPCQYVDVPAALFAAIAPTAEDMRWLAHVRSVSSGDAKPKAAGAAPSTSVGVVVSNRLPTPGGGSTCMLVSLEGMAGLLPGSAGPPTAGTAVRLAVLASWSFTATEDHADFAARVAALDHEPATLQIPCADAAGTVRTTLAMGYTAINHQTRQGAATVSWYRGPLLPFARPRSVTLPVQSADALTRYDPETGMFDVSLSAAWQIGQLTALNDRDFATTLSGWSQRQVMEAAGDSKAAVISLLLASWGGSRASPLQTTGYEAVQDGVVSALLQIFNSRTNP